jgi:hypothetical protein
MEYLFMVLQSDSGLNFFLLDRSARRKRSSGAIASFVYWQQLPVDLAAMLREADLLPPETARRVSVGSVQDVLLRSYAEGIAGMHRSLGPHDLYGSRRGPTTAFSVLRASIHRPRLREYLDRLHLEYGQSDGFLCLTARQLKTVAQEGFAMGWQSAARDLVG